MSRLNTTDKILTGGICAALIYTAAPVYPPVSDQAYTAVAAIMVQRFNTYFSKNGRSIPTNLSSVAPNFRPINNQVCQRVWSNITHHHTPLPVLNGTQNKEIVLNTSSAWAINSQALPALGESNNIFCHFIYIQTYHDYQQNLTTMTRLPAIRHDMVNGRATLITWAFDINDLSPIP